MGGGSNSFWEEAFELGFQGEYELSVMLHLFSKPLLTPRARAWVGSGAGKEQPQPHPHPIQAPSPAPPRPFQAPSYQRY